MVRRLVYYIMLTAVMAVVASCSSSRHAVQTPMIGELTGADYMEKVIEWTPKWDALTAKVGLDLQLDKGGSPHVNGTLRIKRGKVIQLSVAPLLGIEMARMEITPEQVLLVDRLHKQYVEVSFEALSSLANTELDFHILQSLFLNELFLPGKPQLAVTDAVHFHITPAAGRALLETKSGRALTYRFWTTAGEGWLEQTSIGLKGTDYSMDWLYTDFGNLEGKTFPQHMKVSLGNRERVKFALDMKLSRISAGGNWEERTELSSKYKKIELHELLKMLLKL